MHESHFIHLLLTFWKGYVITDLAVRPHDVGRYGRDAEDVNSAERKERNVDQGVVALVGVIYFTSVSGVNDGDVACIVTVATGCPG